jgi:hypothetical protein
MYDASGLPSLRVSEREDWFSWTLRPLADSTPNRLNFVLSFPRTSDSCLILQLPRSARVVDANIVVRSTDRWSDAVERVGDWPVDRTAADNLADLSTTDSFWLLELSGRDQASFSILLNPNRSLFDSTDSGGPANPVWNRLIAKQSLVHTVSAHHVKTISEWEWSETTSIDRTFRIRIPEGMRLRNLKLNDRDVSPRFSNRMLEVAVPLEEGTGNGSAPMSRTRFSAEFLSRIADLSTDDSGATTVPAIECVNGYVISGTLGVLHERSIELRNIGAGAGRLETLSNVGDNQQRLDYSWFQTPPAVSIQIAPRELDDTAELFTRLTTDSQGAVAIIKMEWSPWHPSAPNRIRIGSRWSVEAAQVNHPGLAISIEESGPGIPTELRIDPNGPVDLGRVPIELQLSQKGDETLDEPLDYESLIELPGRKSEEALAIEPGYASRVEYLGDYASDFCEESALTAWQRDRLPRLGRFLLFRMSEGKLPPLRWKRQRSFVGGSIETKVSDLDDTVEVEYLFDLPVALPLAMSLELQLPGSWRWEWESSQGWKPFDTNKSPASDLWRLKLPSPSSPDNRPRSERTRFRATGRLSSVHRGENGMWDLPIPRLSSDEPVEYVLRAASSLRVVPDQTRGQWSLDREGELVFTWQDPIPDQAELQLSIQHMTQPDQRRWWIERSDLHIAIDSLGQQRAVLELAASGLRDEEWEFGLNLPEGWSVDRIVHDGGDSYIVRGDRKGYRIRRRPGVDRSGSCRVNLKVVLAGPPGEQRSYREWGIVPIQTLLVRELKVELDCPVGVASRTLWVPDPYIVSRTTEASQEGSIGSAEGPAKLQGIWSSWHWTSEAADWLGCSWMAEQPESGSIRQRCMPPAELVPASASQQWRAIPVAREPFPVVPDEPEIWVLRLASSPRGLALWLVISSLIALALLRRVPWICLVLVGAATIAGHWLPESFAIWARSTWMGLVLGSFLFLLSWIVRSPGIRPMDRGERRETWDPWNEPALASESLSDPAVKASIAVALCLMLSAIAGLPMVAQDPSSSATPIPAYVFDVLIPIDDQGEPIEGVVYVPASLLVAEGPGLSNPPAMDRESYTISARHMLRFDGRSLSFGNAEQSCTHQYDVWIGEDGVGRPWRIPFSSERSRLNRFLVDGAEVVSSRLVKSDNTLLWIPDRPGRRTLQIESQLRIRPSDSDRERKSASTDMPADSRSPRSWVIDVPIVPSANALLEVETDAGWSVEFDRFGRFSNPSIGKFLMQLGNKDRLVGELSPSAAAASVGGGLASEPGGESPQINTELFIDRGQLLARTILEYPRPVDAPDEFELESDTQWQPIGNLWGDAQLIDIRPGSTLDRRRYVLRWAAGFSDGTAKRSVTTTWIPIGGTNLRNVLFAECRDRRVRPGTLRYARSAGSIWTLEGINTWVPSINTKERIEWMELSERPIATSLRIPVSGGFGVLRQQNANKLQQARIAHQWGIGSSRISIRSRIDFADPIDNRKNLIFSLPSTFQVNEVLSRSSALAHATWVDGERRYIQVFVDREIGDISELIVVAEQDAEAVDSFQPATPVIAMDGVPLVEQYAELSADPVWRVRVGSVSQRGRGIGTPMATLEFPLRTDVEPIQIERLKDGWSGTLLANVAFDSEGDRRWRLRMIDNTSWNAKPTLTLSMPIELAREWSSEATIRELPSLDSSRRTIQIQPRWSEDQRGASFEVEWTADAKAIRDPDWIRRLRIESDSGLRLVLEESERGEERESGDGRRQTEHESMDRPGLLEWFEVHRVRSPGAGTHPAQVHSTLWSRNVAPASQATSELQVTVGDEASVEWVSVNGEGVFWRREGNALFIALPPIPLSSRVDIHTAFQAIGPSSDVLPPASTLAIVPTLAKRDGIERHGWIVDGREIRKLNGVGSISGSQLLAQECEQNLEILDAMRRHPLSKGKPNRWSESLAEQSRWMLIALIEREGEVACGNSEAWSLDSSSTHRVTHPENRGSVLDTDRWIATLGMGLLAVLAPWIWLSVGRPMQRSPWWPLTLVGFGIWIVTGTWVPALVLAGVGLALAIDSYLIVNERFRQTGIRAPR